MKMNIEEIKKLSKQQAVDDAVRLTTESCERTFKAESKDAVEQERKAIGINLDELAMKEYKGKIPMWLVQCICKMERGESLEVKHDK